MHSNDENKAKNINEKIELNRDSSKIDDLDIMNIVMGKLNLDENNGKTKSKFDFANMNNDDDNEINKQNGIFKSKADYSNIFENDITKNSNNNIMIKEEMNNINQGFIYFYLISEKEA